jgi:replicative DNA helicase
MGESLRLIKLEEDEGSLVAKVIDEELARKIKEISEAYDRAAYATAPDAKKEAKEKAEVKVLELVESPLANLKRKLSRLEPGEPVTGSDPCD